MAPASDNFGSDQPPGGSAEPATPTRGEAEGMAPAGDHEPYADALVELNALLGRGTRYTGNLHFDGRVRIEGQFRGDIRGEDVLVIGQGAEIDGSIEVGACIVTGGTVRANIRARDAIELHAPAVVIGDLHAPNIFIDRGVQFQGACKMAPLDALSAPPPPAATAEEGRERDTQPGLGGPSSEPPDAIEFDVPADEPQT